MKRKTAGILLLGFILCVLNAQEQPFEREAILTESAVKAFIDRHESLISDIKTAREGNWLSIKGCRTSPREALDAITETEPPKKIRMLFKQYGLDSETGHLQIAVMQYGIVALEIEEALSEVAAMKRTKREQAADKKVAAYLNELKSQINSADLEFIRTYRKQLRPIFNTGD